jgi:hypothetical protein
MAGNAHRRRHGNVTGCIYCQYRPKEARALHLFRNKNGHRRNLTRKRRGRRRKTITVSK